MITHCPYGQISYKWTITGNNLNMDISIPQNITADIFVPNWQGKILKRLR